MAFATSKFTGAVTGYAVGSCPLGHKLVMTHVSIMLDGGASVNVAANIGFGKASLSTAATGHPGIVPGSGFIDDARWDGGIDEDILFSCGAPTSGSIQVNIIYEAYRLKYS